MRVLCLVQSGYGYHAGELLVVDVDRLPKTGDLVEVLREGGSSVLPWPTHHNQVIGVVVGSLPSGGEAVPKRF